jgi:hypothetical protein
MRNRNRKTTIGVMLVCAVCFKAVLSVVLNTGFDTMLVSINGGVYVVGLGMMIWGRIEEQRG